MKLFWLWIHLISYIRARTAGHPLVGVLCRGRKPHPPDAVSNVPGSSIWLIGPYTTPRLKEDQLYGYEHSIWICVSGTDICCTYVDCHHCEFGCNFNRTHKNLQWKICQKNPMFGYYQTLTKKTLGNLGYDNWHLRVYVCWFAGIHTNRFPKSMLGAWMLIDIPSPAAHPYI